MKSNTVGINLDLYTALGDRRPAPPKYSEPPDVMVAPRPQLFRTPPAPAPVKAEPVREEDPYEHVLSMYDRQIRQRHRKRFT
jgi:hypothetical protein